VDEAGLKYDVNDFDLWAIEAGLQLKEKNNNAGEVVAICLGPDAAQEQIRKALAMGADRGVLLQASTVPADGLAIARALAAELKDGGYDLVLFGRIAIRAARPAVRDQRVQARHQRRHRARRACPRGRQ
jgi:electron transfer flavoprotein beta subunit